jgi:nitrite reductase/ring-hydroxylating ferredoxin subunit/uncharacterized membrane protein
MLVALPIGLWIGGFVFSAIAISTASPLLAAAGFYTVIAGCVGAVLAAVPGVIDLFGSIPDRSSARKRGYIHGGVNSLALLIFIYAAWRQGSPTALPDKITVAVELLGILAIGYSGWLGGTLVYRNQIGVDHRFANAGKLKERTVENFSRPVCNQGELGEGQAMLVRIGDARVTVASCAEGIFAFEDHCTHRGGPLSDGAIVGCAVQCPWHGSQFDVKTGRVIAGPAEEKITVYDVRISSGEVWVVPDVEGKTEKRSEKKPEKKVA